MMYLIIKEIKLSNSSIFDVASFTNDFDKANDMLQGHNLINKDKGVVFSILKFFATTSKFFCTSSFLSWLPTPQLRLL